MHASRTTHAVLAALLAVAVAGCGGSSGDSTAGSTTSNLPDTSTSDDAAAALAKSAADCQDTQDPPFTNDFGITYSPLPAGQAQQLSAAIPDLLPASAITARQAYSEKARVGAVMAIAGMNGRLRNDLTAGVSAGAQQDGGTVGKVKLNGQELTLATSPHLTSLIGFNGCYGLIVFGPSKADAITAARPLIPTG